MIKKIALFFAALTTLTLSGCASITMDATHPVKIDTKTAKGNAIIGAKCSLTNDHGTVLAQSGETVQIRRSAKDLEIICQHPEQQDAKGSAISRANMGLAGNLLFGGFTGAIIDHNTGKAYTYPNWIELIFGTSLVFDRSLEKTGEPMIGALPAVTNTATTATPKMAPSPVENAASTTPRAPDSTIK